MGLLGGLDRVGQRWYLALEDDAVQLPSLVRCEARLGHYRETRGSRNH